MSTNSRKTWTFVTNHTQVLLCLAQDPHVRLRDVADRVGITERAAQRIVADLVEAGYVDRSRSGRRNAYTIRRDLAMRHVAQLGHEIGDLIDVLTSERLESPGSEGLDRPGPRRRRRGANRNGVAAR
jgi:DNA-binding MarR family transcriptional regulator